MVSMRHHNNVVADFEPLVKLLPPSAPRIRGGSSLWHKLARRKLVPGGKVL